jgi:hypothetical protein
MSQPEQKRGRSARGKSWVPGQKGQGGEGLSHGYGGSGGDGTGASGPDDGKRAAPRRASSSRRGSDAKAHD